jgi:hypothetical protein
MTETVAHWAMIDSDGRVITHGHCHPDDLFFQSLPDGQTFVARPQHVNCFTSWRLEGEEWVQD